jgi:hypothetical protein
MSIHVEIFSLVVKLYREAVRKLMRRNCTARRWEVAVHSHLSSCYRQLCLPFHNIRLAYL